MRSELLSGLLEPGEIGIEIATPQNRDHVFTPTEQTLRGRFDPALMPYRKFKPSGSPQAKLGYVPGMCICINVDTRTGRIVDPLGLDQNEALLHEAHAASKRQGPPLATPTEVFDQMNDDEIAGWIHFMRRMTTSNSRCPAVAELIPGSAPWPEKLPGRVKVDPFGSHQGAPRYLDEFQRQAENRHRPNQTVSA